MRLLWDNSSFYNVNFINVCFGFWLVVHSRHTQQQMARSLRSLSHAFVCINLFRKHELEGLSFDSNSSVNRLQIYLNQRRIQISTTKKL